MNSNSELSGFLLIDKPIGPTSHQIVGCIRRLLKVDKVGHLGTLDPFASGLLPIMIGNAARLFDEVLGGKKSYLFTVQLGVETDTLDHTGRSVRSAPIPENFIQLGREVIPQFLGLIEQIPPVYSALKMQGRPLYEHMRSTGKLPQEIETKKRSVTIYSLDLIGSNSTEGCCQLTYRAVCSKGTYIRSLARDLAQSIGTVGHCVSLRRELVEPWEVSQAIMLDPKNPPGAEGILVRVLPSEVMVPDMPLLILPQCVLPSLQSGNSFLLPSEYLPSVFSHTESVPLPDRGLVRCEKLTYLAELLLTPLGLRIQPRKKVS